MQTSNTDFFHDLICCPHCHGPLRLGVAGACEGCGTPCRLEGRIIDFLGSRAFRMSAKNDVALATWLLENRPRLASIVEEMRNSPAKDFRAYRAVIEALTTSSHVGPTEVIEMTSRCDFPQVYNDLNRIIAGTAPPSENVQFLLSESQIEAGSMVLDAGCSCGRHLWELVPKSPGLMVGVDINLFTLTLGAMAWDFQASPAQRRWCCASVLNLPFKDGSFTHAISFVTLDLVPACAALRELARVLNVGARLTLIVGAMGHWRRLWDRAPVCSVRRVRLLRELAGNKLLDYGVDWQQSAPWRHLSRQTHFTRKAITRLLNRAGLVLEKCEGLREYKNQPWALGLIARKPGSLGKPASTA